MSKPAWHVWLFLTVLGIVIATLLICTRGGSDDNDTNLPVPTTTSSMERGFDAMLWDWEKEQEYLYILTARRPTPTPTVSNKERVGGTVDSDAGAYEPIQSDYRPARGGGGGRTWVATYYTVGAGGPMYCGSDVYGPYDPNDPTTAAVHPGALPCGTRVTVCANGTCIGVIIKDGCPGCGLQHIDLSRAASAALGHPNQVEVLY